MTISRSDARNLLLAAAVCCTGAITGCRGASLGGFAWNDSKPAWQSAQPAAGSEPGLWGRLTGSGPKKEPELNDPSRLHLSYARLQEQWGNLVEARKSYETVLGRDPGAIEAMVGLARLDQLAGRSMEAEQTIRAALQSDPQNPLANNALGQLYASRKEWSRAMPYLNTAMMGAPGETEYRYDLAVAMARSGDISGAMPHFVQTVGEAEAHYNVGFILYEQGNMAAAEQQLTQALIKQPRLEQASAVLRKIRGTGSDSSMLAGGSEPRSGHTAAPDAARDYRPAAAEPAYARQHNKSEPSTAASWGQIGHSTDGAPQIYPSSGAADRADVRQTTYRSAAGNSFQPAESAPASWPEAGQPAYQGNAADTYPFESSGAGASYGSDTRYDAAPSYSAPASSGGNIPPGLTPEQREQWENQAQSEGYR